eukprot:Skav209314  [mRNA]  locus=scaffold994:505113:506099:+ [translate_table: standard]
MEMPDEHEEGTATELKRRGNAAYAQQEVEEAVRLWNLAIRKHVQELSDGKSCNEEATLLEQSIYLNLAQGYLKLSDGERALRACKVVLYTDQQNAKARYRAAEACVQLNRFEEAEQLLSQLEAPEASKLLQRLQAKRRAQAARDSKQEAAASKKLAAKMSAGLAGFSEDKPEPVPEDKVPRAPMADLGTVSSMTDVSTEAAQAAQSRLARLEASAAGEKPLPEPSSTDFESFRAKAMKRSQAYASAAQRSRKQTEKSQRSVRLDWLRQGHAGHLEDFTLGLREELQDILSAQEAEEAEPAEEAEEAEAAEHLQAEGDACHGTEMDEMD